MYHLRANLHRHVQCWSVGKCGPHSCWLFANSPFIVIAQTATEEAPVSQRLPRICPQTDFVIPYLHNRVQILPCSFGRISFRFDGKERVSWQRDKKVVSADVELGARLSGKNAFTNGTALGHGYVMLR